MPSYVHLKRFTKSELIFNDNETRIVLKFIFSPSDHKFIDSLSISDTVREFAQALLVEAIDASYAIGFVEAILRSTANPTQGAIKVIKSFGKKAAKHWFKNAKTPDLQNVKVYDFVRIEIARRFRTTLKILASTSALEHTGAYLAYQKPAVGLLQAWG